jgi:diadenosine tetraphosphatase ApaH/serine/threonine PP2A family protein phosphatase
VGEGGRIIPAQTGGPSFAGQYDSVLNVAYDELPAAYRRVLASRFSDRAIYYRLSGGFTEAETSMAVLFLPMIQTRRVGILYTRDPAASAKTPEKDAASAGGQMWIHSTPPAPASLEAPESETLIVSRSTPGEVLKHYPVAGPSSASAAPLMRPDEIAALVRLGLLAEAHFGAPQELEWAIDRQGKVWILQSRRLPPAGRQKDRADLSWLEAGQSGSPRRKPSSHEGAPPPPAEISDPLAELVFAVNVKASTEAQASTEKATPEHCRSLRDLIHFVDGIAAEYNVTSGRLRERAL